MQNKQLEAQAKLLTRPRYQGEPDLVTLITLDLKEYVSESAATIFSSFPNIVEVKDMNPVGQMLEINRTLTNVLLTFRALYSIDVSDILIYITFDTPMEEWRNFLNDFVFPFFKEQQVLDKIYGGKK